MFSLKCIKKREDIIRFEGRGGATGDERDTGKKGVNKGIKEKENRGIRR